MDTLLHSRTHRLATFDTDLCTCWVKRDDELGFGISGTKRRKYSSLLPFLIAEAFELIVVVGSVNSNNVLGLCQLLVENRLPFKLYLRGDPSCPLVGNGLLSEMIAGSQRIRWVSRIDWPRVEEIAHQENIGRHIFVIPEGACCWQALDGAKTLAKDIHFNEEQLGKRFAHIFIDAGTGLSAIALLKGLAGHSHVHIVLIAGDEASFTARLNSFGEPVNTPFTLYRPTTAASFGSTNTAIWSELHLVAREEGILLDPIYSAKLFYEARRIIVDKGLSGDILIIHSGGALTLTGFIP